MEPGHRKIELSSSAELRDFIESLQGAGRSVLDRRVAAIAADPESDVNATARRREVLERDLNDVCQSLSRIVILLSTDHRYSLHLS